MHAWQDVAAKWQDSVAALRDIVGDSAGRLAVFGSRNSLDNPFRFLRNCARSRHPTFQRIFGAAENKAAGAGLRWDTALRDLQS
jgi:hypothetical protein